MKKHETSDNPKLRDILQNNWPVIFSSVKVMKVTETVEFFHIDED